MKDVRFGKFVVLVNGLVPAGLLAWDAWHHRAGANPVNYAIRTTGILTLIFLCLTLLVTPLRKVTGFHWLFHFRRLLGLYAFFYGVAHFLIFFVLDRGLSVSSTFSEMVKRPYLVVGSVALFLMVPLAATSMNVMIKRLGAKRWQRLHRLVYLTAILGVVHFYMQLKSKSDIRLVAAYGMVVGILLGYRLVVYLMGRAKGKVRVEGTGGSGGGRWSGDLRVKEIVQETADVRTFRFVGENGKLPFEYLPGQYLTLTLDVGGKKVRRNYTIASTPSRQECCEVTIKREAMGVASGHMHGAIKVGDVVPVMAPAGRFTFTGEGEGIVLLAAGVGITPLMSIVRYLTDRKWAGAIHLIYANKTEGDIIFREEIEGLRKKHTNLHVTMTLTRADGSWGGERGRIDAGMIARLVPGYKGMPFYLCGPAEMLRGTSEILRGMGVAEENVRMESFGVRKMDGANGGNVGVGYTVTFSRSDKTVAADGRPILEMAEEVGIGWDSECRSGICGRCKCRLVSGRVRMEVEDALEAGDKEGGVILLCQARALEDVVVEA